MRDGQLSVHRTTISAAGSTRHENVPSGGCLDRWVRRSQGLRPPRRNLNPSSHQATSSMANANQIVGSHDILFMTLDTLRWDVAEQAFDRGELPHFASVLPARGWERRHTPGTFTFAAHQAFFAGFLPTPVGAGPHPR